MPIDEVTLVRICGTCGFRIETFTVKKDNMMMFSKEEIWCPECQSDQPELRDVSGRHGSIDEEQLDLLATHSSPRNARCWRDAKRASARASRRTRE